MRLRRPLVHLAVLALGSLATAMARDAHAAASDPHLLEAKRRYEALDYEGCLDQVARAERSADTFTERDLALYDGLCSFELEQRDRATSRFRAALRLDPHASLPPYTSPKIVAVFEALSVQVRAEQRADDRNEGRREPAAPSASVSSPAPPAEKTASSHAPPLVSFLLGGVSALSAGTAIYLTVHANDLARDANGARFESDGYELGDRARATMASAHVVFGIAAVTAVAALVIWVVAPR